MKLKRVGGRVRLLWGDDSRRGECVVGERAMKRVWRLRW